jgi:hypothetical protein
MYKVLFVRRIVKLTKYYCNIITESYDDDIKIPRT